MEANSYFPNVEINHWVIIGDLNEFSGPYEISMSRAALLGIPLSISLFVNNNFINLVYIGNPFT